MKSSAILVTYQVFSLLLLYPVFKKPVTLKVSTSSFPNLSIKSIKRPVFSETIYFRRFINLSLTSYTDISSPPIPLGFGSLVFFSSTTFQETLVTGFSGLFKTDSSNE